MSLSSLGERLESIQARVSSAMRSAGRDDEVNIIVVTKNHPATLVAELATKGVRDFGENRHQEAARKIAEFRELTAESGTVDSGNVAWHFLGRLQSNKAKAICEWASVIHSIDSERVLRIIIDNENKPDFFLQYSADGNQNRGGLIESELLRIARDIPTTEISRLKGVMMVAPIDWDEEEAFSSLLRVSKKLQEVAPGAKYISAGMSGDFESAIQYGATHLRIGTAITGIRA